MSMVQVNSFCVSSATEILFIEAMPRSSAWKHINCVPGWRSKTENWAARDDLLEGGYCLLRFLGTKQIRTIEIRIRLAGADIITRLGCLCWGGLMDVIFIVF